MSAQYDAVDPVEDFQKARLVPLGRLNFKLPPWKGLFSLISWMANSTPGTLSIPFSSASHMILVTCSLAKTYRLLVQRRKSGNAIYSLCCRSRIKCTALLGETRIILSLSSVLVSDHASASDYDLRVLEVIGALRPSSSFVRTSRTFTFVLSYAVGLFKKFPRLRHPITCGDVIGPLSLNILTPSPISVEQSVFVCLPCP